MSILDRSITIIPAENGSFIVTDTAGPSSAIGKSWAFTNVDDMLKWLTETAHPPFMVVPDNIVVGPDSVLPGGPTNVLPGAVNWLR